MGSMTRRYFMKMGVLTAAAGAAAKVSGPLIARAQRKEMVVCSWGGAYQEAQRKAMFDPFEKETGIKIIEASPTDYGKLKAMVKSGNTEWDLVDVGDRMVIAGAKDGLLDPIDYKSIDTKDIYPQVIHPFGVGTIYYSSVLGYSTKKYPGGTHPKSWAEFWDVGRFPAARSMRNNPLDNLEFALMADGVPLEKVYPIDVDRAFRAMDRIKKHIKVWWTTGAQSAQVLADGEVDMVVAWNGRITTIKNQGAPVDVEWNQGKLNWDSWVIPKGSRNKEGAMKFIAWASTPKPQADIAKYIPYGPVNKKAFDFIDAKTAAGLPTAPENAKRQLMVDTVYWGENLNALAERWNAWFIKG